MSTAQIIFVVFFIIATVSCSVLPAVPLTAYTYKRIAPPSITPFAASVSTFTKGLNVYAAPYAAGVLPAPLVPRALVPKVVVPAPVPAVVPAAPAVIPSPLAIPAPLAYPAPVIPALAPPLLHPSVAFGARSIHPVPAFRAGIW